MRLERTRRALSKYCILMAVEFLEKIEIPLRVRIVRPLFGPKLSGTRVPDLGEVSKQVEGKEQLVFV